MCVVRPGERIERVMGEGQFEKNASPNHARNLPGMHGLGNVRGESASTPVGAIEENAAEDFEEEIGNPDEDVRVKLRAA